MGESPILFSDAMVRAILSGAKTQTRRPVKLIGAEVVQERDDGRLWPWSPQHDGWVASPFGAPGDRLWVREAHAPRYFDDGRAGYRADFNAARIGDVVPEPRWTPSIHMRRADSRLTLRVTDVRVERVQDISGADATREGFMAGMDAHSVWTARSQFLGTWKEVYGTESWAANPWVWVVSFEREVPHG